MTNRIEIAEHTLQLLKLTDDHFKGMSDIDLTTILKAAAAIIDQNIQSKSLIAMMQNTLGK